MSVNQTGAIQWKKYWRSALPLSAIAGLGIFLYYPLGLLLFVAVIIFAVGHYSRGHQGPLSTSHGAKMGALSGFISYVVVAGAAVLQLALNYQESHRQVVIEFQRRIADNPDPRLQQLVHFLGTDQGFVAFAIFSLVVFLIIFLIVSSFIGAVSVSFSANRDRR